VAYERSPVFLHTLTAGLCGQALAFERTRGQRVRDFLVLAAETVLAPALLAVLLILGLVFFWVLASVLPFLISHALGLVMDRDSLLPLADQAQFGMAMVLLFVFLFAPRVRADRVHAQHWMEPPGVAALTSGGSAS